MGPLPEVELLDMVRDLLGTARDAASIALAQLEAHHGPGCDCDVCQVTFNADLAMRVAWRQTNEPCRHCGGDIVWGQRS